MFIHRIHPAHALNIFALFFGSVGIGFAIVGESQYVLIALIVSSLALYFTERFQSGMDQSEEQFIFGDNMANYASLLIYGILPASLLIRITYLTLWGVIVASLYILAVAMRLAYFNGIVSQGDPDAYIAEEIKPDHTLGVPLEFATIAVPIISLLAYVVSPNVFAILYAIVLLLLALGFVFKQEVPRIPSSWQLWIVVGLIVLMIIYIFLGTFIPAGF